MQIELFNLGSQVCRIVRQGRDVNATFVSATTSSPGLLTLHKIAGAEIKYPLTNPMIGPGVELVVPRHETFYDIGRDAKASILSTEA